VDLKAILDSLSPTAAVLCVAAIAIKWNQIKSNTVCISKIKESLDVINEKLSEINGHVEKTAGWIEGFKNGKK
jgi:hypothetical protein